MWPPYSIQVDCIKSAIVEACSENLWRLQLKCKALVLIKSKNRPHFLKFLSPFRCLYHRPQSPKMVSASPSRLPPLLGGAYTHFENPCSRTLWVSQYFLRLDLYTELWSSGSVPSSWRRKASRVGEVKNVTNLPWSNARSSLCTNMIENKKHLVWIE